MNLRNSLMVFASVVALPAFAADPGLTLMRGELGYVDLRPAPSAKSRSEVANELAAWKRSPTVDGWREVGGQEGWVFVGSSTKSRDRVKQEVREALANPVTPEGWRFFNGELGWTYVGIPGARGGVRTAASAK